ncbi:MAG: hypothetical protein JSV88_12770, partial [Candidatus Aminicenantes bacterium]
MIDRDGVMAEEIGGMTEQAGVMNEKKRVMIAQAGEWLRKPGRFVQVSGTAKNNLPDHSPDKPEPKRFWLAGKSQITNPKLQTNSKSQITNYKQK